MLITSYYDGVELYREQRTLYAKFIKPHRVLSTCRAAGGMQHNLQYLYNHQSCESRDHMRAVPPSAYKDPLAYREWVCEPLGLPAEQCATLGTAANMHNAAFVCEQFRDLQVIAVCTGGVETNAGRAGDYAAYYEHDGEFEKLPPTEAIPGPGTINTMIFISKPLTEGAQTRVIMTATEAKTAALQELAVNSRYSNQLATGTGTDQIGIATLVDDSQVPLTTAGKHSKLGELIGKAVYKATKQTLAQQNKLTPAGQRSAKIHLERFGVNRAQMQDKVASHLNEEDGVLFRKNFMAVQTDPLVVAAMAALVHLRDKMTWGVLPHSCSSEIMATYAAQLVCAISGDYPNMAAYRQQLAPQDLPLTDSQFVDLACEAMAIGFSKKWHR